MTWTKYENNPVINNPGIKDFRDPKVIWVEEYNKWIMVLAVKDHVSFYSSPNLREWKFESDFGIDVGAHGGVWECPDLFKMKVNNTEIEKWVLLVSINPGGPNGGSATQYFVGEFDGNEFNNESEGTQWLDYGKDNYAGVTWSDVPKDDGRNLFIGWMSNWQYATVVPTSTWRSAMTLPRELILNSDNEAYKIHSRPVSELKKIIGQPQIVKEEIRQVEDSTYLLEFSNLEYGDFSISFTNDLDEKLEVQMLDGKLSVDRSSSGITGFSSDFASVHSSEIKVNEVAKIQVYMDVSSVEIFVNNGEVVMTELVFPRKMYNKIHNTGNVTYNFYPISSIWR